MTYRDPLVAGYIDTIQGTAVLTLPVQVKGGRSGMARVEAEAGWVGTATPAPTSRNTRCGWLLRHLEVVVDGESTEVNPG